MPHSILTSVTSRTISKPCSRSNRRIQSVVEIGLTKEHQNDTIKDIGYSFRTERASLAGPQLWGVLYGSEREWSLVTIGVCQALSNKQCIDIPHGPHMTDRSEQSVKQV